LCSASAANFEATTWSTGNTILPAPFFSSSAATAILSSSTRLLPVAIALGAEERVRHAPADEQRIHALEQGLDDLDLVRDLRAPQHGHERPLLGWTAMSR
jgi:hypothetical protein